MESPQTPNLDRKHTICNVFSITIRTGNGLNLGNKTVSQIEQYFEDHFTQYILSVEKTDVEAHFQGGCFLATPKRQDHIFRDLKKLVLNLYIEQSDEEPSTKKLEQVARFALMVKPHTSFKALIKYCSKDGFFAIHRFSLNEYNQTYLYSRIYCEDHSNPLSIYHEDTVTMTKPWYSCPKCPPLPWYFIKNIQKIEN